MEKIKQNIDYNITADKVLFFDLDGTLVDTDYANYLSYIKAIETVTQSDNNILYNFNQRFNRVVLKKVLPNLTEDEYVRIIQEKEKFYKDFLPETKLINLVADILLKYSKTNKTVLVTNCRKDRVSVTLNYFGLTDKFSKIFHRQLNGSENRLNKYENAISHLNISTQSVIVFENEKSEINDALLAGIPIQNIISH